MKPLYKTMLLTAAVAAGAGLFSACDDDEDLIAPDALFRPALSDDDIIIGLTPDTIPYVEIDWDDYASATHYVVAIEANDGSDSRSLSTEKSYARFDNLNYDTEYNISIRCENADNGLKSKDFVKVVKTSDFPTQLKNVSAANIIDTQARIIWSEGVAYDSIRVVKTSVDSCKQSVALTADDNDACAVIIRELEPKTEYRVEAYKAGKYAGKKVFSTVGGENYSGAVLDLRSLTDEESEKIITSGLAYANLMDSMVACHPGEDITVVLQGGTTYKVSGAFPEMPNNKFKFVTGLTLAGNAKFVSTGGFSLNSEKNVQSIVFEKIDFEADNYEANYPDGVLAGTTIQNGSRQVFNVNLTTSTTLDSIVFKGCSMKGYRAIVRMQGAGTADAHSSINNVLFSDCQIDAIGDQGIVTTSNKATAYKTITFKNSTVANVKTVFDLRSTLENVAINIQNSTFCYCGTAQFINCGADQVTLAVSSSIFNGSLGEAYTTSQPEVGNYVFWAKTIGMDIKDSYRLGNFALKNIGTEEAPATADLNDITVVEASDADVFADPSKGDFTVVSDKLKGAGDPRWL